jgi:DNA-binding transcriptional LysR family regulator
MVRNGLGFTVLPYAAVQAEVARGALLYRPIDRDPLCTVHAIASRGGSPFIAGARRLLRDVMSRLAASGVWAGVAPIPAGTAGSASSATMETAIA